MKRSFIPAFSCACALVIALFGLTACGGSSSSSTASSSAASSSAASDEGESTVDPSDVSASDFSDEEIRAVFEQAVAGMSEFYKGSTPVGETIYYAGGADGDNAILVLIVPETNASAIFIGPAVVGDDNSLSITDETTGSTISFAVIGNEDGTYSFSMGEQYGAAIMNRCSSAEVVDALTEVVVATSQAQAAAAAAANAEGGEGESGAGTTPTE